jgi:hypothetical protein
LTPPQERFIFAPTTIRDHVTVLSEEFQQFRILRPAAVP